MKTQSDKIIAAFGSGYRLAQCLSGVMGRRVPMSTVSRWQRGRDGGRAGQIPARWHWYIVKAAKLYGVKLELGDFLDDEVLDELD